MIIQVIEGFEGYTGAGSDNEDEGWIGETWSGYDLGSLGSIEDGLSGRGKSLLYHHTSFTSQLDMTFDADSQVTLAFAVMWLNPYTGNEFLVMLDPTGNHQWGLKYDAGNRFALIGEGGLPVAYSDTPILLNQVYRFCIRVDTAAGTVATSINGADDAGLTGSFDIQDAASNLQGVLRIQDPVTGGTIVDTHYLDDIIIGTGELVDWGPMEVLASVPTADVVSDWTPLSGTDNFAMVDEIPANNTDYNFADTAGLKDIFEFTDMPTAPESVLAVGVQTLGKKEETAARFMRHLIRIGGVDYNGDDFALFENYKADQHIWPLNPATGLAWTQSDVNALQAGYEHR